MGPPVGDSKVRVHGGPGPRAHRSAGAPHGSHVVATADDEGDVALVWRRHWQPRRMPRGLPGSPQRGSGRHSKEERPQPPGRLGGGGARPDGRRRQPPARRHAREATEGSEEGDGELTERRRRGAAAGRARRQKKLGGGAPAMTGERRGWLSTSSTGDRERGSWARWGNKRVEPEEALYMTGRCEEFGDRRQWLVEWGVDVGSWWGSKQHRFLGKTGGRGEGVGVGRVHTAGRGRGSGRGAGEAATWAASVVAGSVRR